MNILYIKHFFVGFIVSEIPRVSVFGNSPYSVTFPYIYICYLFFYFGGVFVLSMKLDEVFMYTHMALMSLQIRSRIMHP